MVSEMTDQAPAGIGDNKPPSDIDPFVLRLEEANAGLLRRQTALEMRAIKLPKESASDEDVALISTFAVDARALAREIEAVRVEVKQPYLNRERQIDGWFNPIKEQLAARAAAMEKRNGPFLLAKRQRDEAEQRAKADRAREEAAERQRLADEAAAEQRRLERERAEAEQRVRDEEQERQRQARADAEAETAQQAPPAGETVRPVSEQETSLQDAHSAAQAASANADKLAEEARVAQLAADRAENKAGRVNSLGKVAGETASARAEMIWVGRVKSFPAIIQSLGPLGPFFNEQTIRDAVDRAARSKDRPAIPGAEFSQEIDVVTRARRS